MTRFQKLCLATLATTLVLVAVGGFTRGSGSGFGCGERWPLCEGGVLGGLLPRWEFHMVVEWSHRWLAAMVGVLVVITAIVAWRDHGADRRVTWPATTTVVAVGLQGYLGRVVVTTGLDRDLVTAHLASAMLVLALLGYTTVSGYCTVSRSVPDTHVDLSWSRLLAVGAMGVLIVLLLGSAVHDVYVPGWPLVEGSVVPRRFDGRTLTHLAHRVTAAGLTWLAVWLTFAGARRRRPRVEVVLVRVAAAAIVVNVVLGAAHVLTEVALSGLVVAHLAAGAVAWTAFVVAAVVARRHDERLGWVEVPA